MYSLKTIILPLLLVLSTATRAQQITGLWYSGDSSRIYQIKSSGNDQYEAIIYTSARQQDLIGFTTIKNLQYNNRKKRYEGVMYAFEGGKPVFIKIKFGKSNTDQLRLKLSRMFIMDVTLKWNRALVISSRHSVQL